MRAINHALTGAVIGFSIGSPIAIPIAFVSHFVLDSMPHYGDKTVSEVEMLNSKKFQLLLVVDAVLCALLVIVLGLYGANNWQLAAICAFSGASPDLFSIPRFKMAIFEHKKFTGNAFQRFHKKIQWGERPWGKYVEIIWLIASVAILVKIT
jgi:hypothetical protein